MNTDGKTGHKQDAVVKKPFWKANSPTHFHWAKWENGEESAFFHQGSGETLLLNPLGVFLLKTICEDQVSSETLAQRAAEYFDLPMDGNLTRAINSSLFTFEQKGLVLSVRS